METNKNIIVTNSSCHKKLIVDLNLHGLPMSDFKFIQPKENEDGELLKAALLSENPKVITFNKGVHPNIKKMMIEIARTQKGENVHIFYFNTESETETEFEGAIKLKGLAELKEVLSAN